MAVAGAPTAPELILENPSTLTVTLDLSMSAILASFSHFVTLSMVMFGLFWLIRKYVIKPPLSQAEEAKRLRESHDRRWNRHQAFAQLAHYSYSDVNHARDGDQLLHFGYKFTLLRTRSAGALRAFKIVESHGSVDVDTIVILLRGSYTWKDWLDDASLVAAGMSYKNSFPIIASKIIEDVNAFYLELLESGFVKSNKVIFVGHSLAASLSEVLLCHSQKQHPSRHYSAIVFDSPGTPEDYRRAFAVPCPIPNLCCINSAYNLVNTLNTQLSDDLWACEDGSNIQLQSVVKRALDFIPATVEKHRMESIIKCLAEHRYHREDRRKWVKIAGTAVGWLGTALDYAYAGAVAMGQYFKRKISGADPPKHSITPPRLIPEPRQPAAASIKVEPRQQMNPDDRRKRDAQLIQNDRMPRIASKWTLKKVYNIRCKPFGEDIDGMDDWTALQKLVLNEQDMIIPFFGCTNRGKTSTLKRLLGLCDDDRSLPISNGVHNSVFPLIALYKVFDINADTGEVVDPNLPPPPRTKTVRIYLVDMPGFGAEEQVDAAHKTEMQTNDASKLLQLTSNVLGCAVLVIKDNLIDAEQKLYEPFVEKGIPLIYAVNVNGSVYNQERLDDLIASHKKALKFVERSLSDSDMVLYSVFDDPRGHPLRLDHIPLEDSLHSFIVKRRLDVVSRVAAQRRANAGGFNPVLPLVVGAAAAAATSMVMVGAGGAGGVGAAGVVLAQAAAAAAVGVGAGAGTAIAVGFVAVASPIALPVLALYYYRKKRPQQEDTERLG